MPEIMKNMREKAKMLVPFFVAFSMMLVLSCRCLAGEPATSVYQIRKAEKPPVIDGRIDTEEWRLAEWTDAFTGPYNPEGTDISLNKAFGTKACALWDSEHLYVAFVCMQPPPFYADRTERDAKLHEQDVAEVYLDVAGDMMQYVELHVSPLGTSGDIYHVWSAKPDFPPDKIDWKQTSAHKSDSAWDLDGFRAASAPIIIDGKTVGWTVEAEIPVSGLLVKRGLSEKLAEGRKIRMNFLRYVYELSGDGKRIHRQLNWSKTMKGCPHVSPMNMQDALCSR